MRFCGGHTFFFLILATIKLAHTLHHYFDKIGDTCESKIQLNESQKEREIERERKKIYPYPVHLYFFLKYILFYHPQVFVSFFHTLHPIILVDIGKSCCVCVCHCYFFRAKFHFIISYFEARQHFFPSVLIFIGYSVLLYIHPLNLFSIS